MKSLIQFVNKKINIINDTLFDNIVLEFYLRNENIILEQYGIFDGFDKLINVLYKKIRTAVQNNETFIQYKSKQYFFNYLEIHIIIGKNSGAGVNFTKSKNDNYVIFINSSKKIDISYIRRMLTHEVKHCYDIHKEGYDNYIKRLNKRKYLEISNWEDENKMRGVFKQYLYWTNPQEVNAYIGELSSLIKFKKPKNPTSAYEIIKDSVFYKTFLDIEDFCNDILKNDDLCKSFFDLYRKTNNDRRNFTNRQIISVFKSDVRNIRKKLDNIIPNIICDNMYGDVIIK